MTTLSPNRYAALIAALTLLSGAASFAAQPKVAPRRVRFQTPARPNPKDFAVSPLQTQVLGSRTWLNGAPGAIRVIVSNHSTGKPIRADVSIDYTRADSQKEGGKITQSVFSGRTNDLGTLEARVAATNLDGVEGANAAGTFVINVHSSLGDDKIEMPVTVQESAQVLLTCDKPLYQPGQTIHVRALAMNMANRAALADVPVTFEIEDARGNKVFKQKGTFSKFGLASVDFVLADEVNMGAFTLRAVLPQTQVEKKVRVERYVLPKYKVALTPAKPFYLPGETVEGTLEAKYFFGKPVSGGDVTLTISTIDIGVTKLTELKGKTDAQGKYKFSYTLPKSFVGQPFEQGKAVVEFAGNVKDGADHRQTVHVSVPVVKEPLLVVLVPENKTLVPNVENRVYVACATPDGTPLKNATLTVSIAALANGPNQGGVGAAGGGLGNGGFGGGGFGGGGAQADNAAVPVRRAERGRRLAAQAQDAEVGGGKAKAAANAANKAPELMKPLQLTLKTDDLGLATVAFNPKEGGALLTAKATDAQGRTATTTQTVQNGGDTEGVLLRSDKTLAKVGERLNFVGLTSAKGGTLYLDIVRDKQTILTLAEPIHGGQTRIEVPVTPDMVGTLQVHAYKILPNEDIVRDTRTLIVSPADDLHITTQADLVEYKPGGEATIRFTVADAAKHPVLAALGLAVVDESVFALSELQPGLEKIYFTLEKELMEPKYEIHGLSPTFLLGQPEPLSRRDETRQRAAAMLLAGVPEPSLADFRTDTYMVRSQEARQKAVTFLMEANRKIVNAVQKYRQDTKASVTPDDSLFLLVEKGYLQASDLLDPWGHFYTTDLYGNKNYDNGFALNSAGPDGKWETGDDVSGVSMYGWQGGRGRPGKMVRRRMAGRGGLVEEELADGAERDKLFKDDRVMDFGRARGGFGGGGFGGAPGAPMMLRALAAAPEVAKSAASSELSNGLAGGAPAPRIREYFPETMYWNPALLTDENGKAELKLPIADSITTWRMSLTANSQSGQLGSATAPLKVFQDFFVDIDLPVSLTQNDRVTIPVAVYNYLPTPQTVTLTLDTQPWFTLEGSAKQSTQLEAGQVKVINYPITVHAIGRHALTVTAQGSKLSDATRRTIAVTPDGKAFDNVISDRLEKSAEKTVTIPRDAIAGASSLWVKLYPGAFSSVVEGLDGILQMPNGCFEQTSSTTYPNVLVLDYLKANKKINPEIQLKAEQYINIGYQRLVTFECKAGGFSWFGDEPAHQILTAYGLLEFADMSRVHEVDPALIARTQAWLAGKQKADGSWEEKNQGIAEGIINRQTGALRSTAYVAWALAETGYAGPELAKGVAYITAHQEEAKDAYTLAVILNLLTKTQNGDNASRVEKDGELTGIIANRLIALAKTTDKTAFWPTEGQTFTGANGVGADIETSGLATYALAKWGRNAGFLTKALTYLVQSKDGNGTWNSTQGTVWAMKSLLYASRNGSGGKGTVTVLANGQKAATFAITPDDSDVMRQISLAENLKDGANAITLQYDGDGSLLYQIAERHYLPWEKAGGPTPANGGPLTLDVAYDKTTLAQDDTATVTVKIHNRTDRVAEMPLIDVGVPPGFTVVPDKLDAAVQAKTISKYTVAARQVIVYLEKLLPGDTVTVSYQVRAKYPIKAKTPLSKVYPYYNPEKAVVSAPQDIEVRK